MLTTRPHLTVLRPSSTTISYTVSTSLPLQSIPSYVIHWLVLAIRLIIGSFTFSALFVKYFNVTPSFLDRFWKSIVNVPWIYAVPILFGALFLVLRRFHTGTWSFLICSQILSHEHSCTIAEESLLVIRSLGIQTSSISPYYLLPATTRFIPTSQVRDIFIHEAFRGFEVRYYLAVVVEGEAEVVVVFPVRAYAGHSQ